MSTSSTSTGTSRTISRRGVLKGGLALAAAGLLPFRSGLGAAVAPADKLRVAVIGVGGMGSYSVDQAVKERFVALADVDENTIGKMMTEKVKDGPPPKVFHDYRKMLDEMHGEIDVVLIATPDHHHAPAASRAIALGKHTFCQKPLAHNIAEVYALAKAAREKKVLTQMGNQGQCGDGIRRLAEYVWGGAVGDVKESHTILGRNFGGHGGRPAAKPVPKGLHWDVWLGPAPDRAFHDGLHPFNWRSWRQFGTGTIGDMACHNVNPVFWALRLGGLKKFTVECVSQTPGSEEQYAQDNVLRYEIPEREADGPDGARVKLPAATCYVYDHDKLVPEVMQVAAKEGQPEGKKVGEFSIFVGDKGTIRSDNRILTPARRDEFKPPKATLPRAHGGPIEDLYYGIRNGTTPASNFPDAAGPLTAFALTGHLAMSAGVGKKVEWDVEKMECTNLPDVNQHVRREYRKGWELVV